MNVAIHYTPTRMSEFKFQRKERCSRLELNPGPLRTKHLTYQCARSPRFRHNTCWMQNTLGGYWKVHRGLRVLNSGALNTKHVPISNDQMPNGSDFECHSKTKLKMFGIWMEMAANFFFVFICTLSWKRYVRSYFSCQIYWFMCNNKGVTPEWDLNTLPLPSVTPGTCWCGRAPGANQ